MNTGTIHPLSGLVYCNECNNYMRKKNSGKHNYLVCNNCHNSIRYDELIKIIQVLVKKKEHSYNNQSKFNNNKGEIFVNPKIDFIQYLLDRILIGKLNYKRTVQIKWNT